MSDQSGSSRLRVLFETALEDYKQQTGIELAEHPLAERLQDSNSVESVTAILREQAQDFKEFREKDKVLKPLKRVLTVLHRLSSVCNFARDHVGLNLPPVKAIQTGLGILLSAVKGVIDDYSALADLLESIGHFLNRLEIYTEISPTEALDEMIVKILVELLSTLALTTKETKQGKLKKLVRKLVGEKKMEEMVQRLDRLTQDEARQTVAQVLKVVHGLVGNMKMVMDDGKVSVDHLKESLEIMHQVASDLNKAKRDNLQENVFRWLSPPDPWKNHHAACESCHPGTAEWFIHGNTFPEWRTSEVPGSLLWVHGKPGAGKSVFCSTIIEDIRAMQKVGLASLAFFYCDFREERKKELRGLLASFLVQLYHQSDSYFDILSKFYSEHDKGSRPPSDDALARCLKDLLKLPGLAPVYLIVDALDECPNPSVVRSPRAKVLNLVEELVKSQIQNLRVCVTSRPESDIKDVLDPLIFRSISLHDEGGQKKDIEDYIKSVINTRTTKRWKEEHRRLAIHRLTEGSNGMFRWVDCQVVHICNCIPARLLQALVELPETLDETYERTLQGIDKANWEYAHRMFQFVSVASRPLHVEELADLLAFDFKAGSIPKFHKDWRLEDPADAVLSTCSTLLAIVNDQGSPVIQFSHFSVKEFLTSNRLVDATDIIIRRYHVSMTPAHTIVAQSCLGILLHLDKDVTSDSLRDLPLAEYAAEHWVDHARFEDVSQNVEDGMKRLFDPNEPHLAISVWICDPAVPKWNRMTRNETPLPLPQTSLHYAAFWGLYSVVEFLIVERSQDVSSRDSADKGTPLHLASRNGHVKAACKLIEHGAHATVKNNVWETPLHLASREGELDVARMLIEHGTDPAAPTWNGMTPLHLASERGQVDVARMLIERGVDLTSQPGGLYAWTPLHSALYAGKVDVARMLIERGADVTAQTNEGFTPLYIALQKGAVDVARMLIEQGAGVAASTNEGRTPLHLASEVGDADVARMLIEHGADLTARTDIGGTPLHLASQKGEIDVARMLIEHGADLTALDNSRGTPLHTASYGGHADVARVLIEHGADLTAADENQRTPLHLALQQKHVDAAHVLIEHSADMTVGWTPLHLASYWGQISVARKLIEHGADLTAHNNDWETPLHLALRGRQMRDTNIPMKHDVDVTAQNNLASYWGQVRRAIRGEHMEVASMLIKRGVDVAAQDKDGETALHLATYWGEADVARMLIKHGVDVTTQNKDGDTALHLALRGGQMKVASMLIKRGVDVTAQNKDGKTALHLALRERQLDVALILIERGADMTVSDKDGETPLRHALREGQLEAVLIFIEHGANMTVPDKDGETPLHLALREGRLEAVRIFIEHCMDLTAQNKDAEKPLHLASYEGQTEVARMLIDLGADTTARNEDRETPLHLASQEGHVEVAIMLIDRGADITAQDKDGETSLHLASFRGQLEVARMLVEHGADVTAQNKFTLTPLHLASQEGQVDVARLLIECGADVTAQDEDGETPLHLAVLEGQVEVSRMLIERGADVTVQNRDGLTPLQLASERDGSEIAEIKCLFHEHGADRPDPGAHDNTD